MFPFQKSARGILPISQEIDEKDGGASESTAMLDDDEYLQRKPPSTARRLLRSNIPWIISTISLFVYILFFTQFKSPVHKEKINVAWSPTDVGKLSTKKFKPSGLTFKVYARHLIDESMKTFTTGLDYNNTNHTLQHTPSDGLKYVGPPGPEIDAAWEAIAGGKSHYPSRLISSLRFIFSSRDFHNKGGSSDLTC
jgi:hypothetical protein